MSLTTTQRDKIDSMCPVAYDASLGTEIYANNISSRLVNLTASSLTLTEAAHDGRVITVNAAAGSALTLPAATGSGFKCDLILGTTVTSNTTTVKVADATDIMTGVAIVAQDAANTGVLFETAADSDTITFNGGTTGGIKGDRVELIDIASNLWYVRVTGSATGTEATPFSATVS